MAIPKYCLLLFGASTLIGCEAKTLDECLVLAAQDAKSVAALDILKSDCERKFSNDRKLAKLVREGEDRVNLSSFGDLVMGQTISVTRSTITKSDNGITASVTQKSAIGDYAEHAYLFDKSGSYKDRSDGSAYAVLNGVKEFDCAKRRTRWLSVKLDFYVGMFGRVGPIPPHSSNALEEASANLLNKWEYVPATPLRDFTYICEGRILDDSMNKDYMACGKEYSSSCST